MIDNVTVIIPAHNRPDRLQRLLDYYSATDIRVIVSDSSTQQFTGSFNPSQVTYRHYSRMHFFLKIKEIMPLIETPYVLYCADDDFTVPAAIAEIVRFMDANPDYSIVQGHYLTFTPTGDTLKFYPRYIRNFNNTISHAAPIDRLHAQKGMYASMLYGVTRTDIFKDIYSYCFDPEGKLRFTNLFLAEEFFNHAVLIYGKYATLPCFYSARERIAGSATETTTPLSVIKNDPAFASEFNGFLDSLGLMLADHDNIPFDQAREIMFKLSQSPIDNRSVTFKRRVNSFLAKHAALKWASRLSEWRYHQKGFKAVKGLDSYPCHTDTPDILDIKRACNKH